MLEGIRRGFLTMIVLGLASMLTGCFEVTADAEVRDNGEAKVAVELAVSAELIAFMENPAFAKQASGEGAPDFLKDCGKSRKEQRALPPGVRSVEQTRGMRAGMVTCTFVADLSDPILAFENAKTMDIAAPDKAPAPDFVISKLASGAGYRIKGRLTPPKSQDIPPEAEKMAAAIMVAMLANRFITVTISSARIENTNGELAPDGRRVTWKIPLISLLNPHGSVPLDFEADVIYSEGMFAKLKRKLFE